MNEGYTCVPATDKEIEQTILDGMYREHETLNKIEPSPFRIVILNLWKTADVNKILFERLGNLGVETIDGSIYVDAQDMLGGEK